MCVCVLGKVCRVMCWWGEGGVLTGNIRHTGCLQTVQAVHRRSLQPVVKLKLTSGREASVQTVVQRSERPGVDHRLTLSLGVVKFAMSVAVRCE